MSRAPVPATILGGFLGAGKTTLLNRLLDRAVADGRRVAVVQNELGAEGIDGSRLGRRADVLVELEGGCVCCTVRDRLTSTLADLAARRPRFDELVVETTGVADPGPVVQAFMPAPLRGELRIERLVTVVDAAVDERTRTLPVWRRQVRLADLIALSKVDLVDAGARERLERELRALNEAAPVVASLHGDADIAAAGFRRRATRGRPVDGEAGVGSVAAAVPGEVVPRRVERWIAALRERPGVELYRAKGTLAVPGDPRRYEIDAVRDRLSGRFGERWDTAPRSRVVVIGRGLAAGEVRAGFERCAA